MGLRWLSACRGVPIKKEVIMRTMQRFLLIPLLLMLVIATAPAAMAQDSYRWRQNSYRQDTWRVEVPAGTRFLVELRTRLDANTAEPGDRFEATTLEPLYLSDRDMIPAGTWL